MTSNPSVRNRYSVSSAANGSRSASNTSTLSLDRRSPRLLVRRRDPLPQDAVRVSGTRSRTHGALDERQLLELGTGVEALAAGAPFRDDHLVTVLPRSQRGRRDARASDSTAPML